MGWLDSTSNYLILYVLLMTNIMPCSKNQMRSLPEKRHGYILFNLILIITKSNNIHQRCVIFRTSCLLKNALFFLPNISAKVLLAQQATKGTYENDNLTHWDAEETDADLHAGNYVEDFRYASGYDPIVSSVGEAEAEDVLEDEETGECFDGDFA